MYETIAFVDFDGTITMEDTLEGAIRLFATQEEFDRVKGKLAAGEMTLSQVVRYAFDGAPSDRLPRMMEYVEGVALRPGFPAFLDEMDRRGIPVVVVSGGVRQFVEKRLAPWRDRLLGMAVDAIFARDVLDKYLAKMGRPYLPYETFFDVHKALENGLVPFVWPV